MLRLKEKTFQPRVGRKLTRHDEERLDNEKCNTIASRQRRSRHAVATHIQYNHMRRCFLQMNFLFSYLI